MTQFHTEGGGKNLAGPRLRALRKKAGLSQEQLAAQLQLLGMDVERGVIKRMELGKRAISDIELHLLAQYFQVSHDYLLDGTTQRPLS